MQEKSQDAQNVNFGFTLLELLGVIVIISILSSIITPQIVQNSRDSEIAVVQSSLQTIQKQIDIYHIKNGSYPDTFDPRWFRGYILPKHPLNDGSFPEIHYYSGNSRSHPLIKPMNRYGAYWYNITSGVVRSRVPEQQTEAKTLAFYNQLNQSSLISMSQTTE